MARTLPEVESSLIQGIGKKAVGVYSQNNHLSEISVLDSARTESYQSFPTWGVDSYTVIASHGNGPFKTLCCIN